MLYLFFMYILLNNNLTIRITAIQDKVTVSKYIVTSSILTTSCFTFQIR